MTLNISLYPGLGALKSGQSAYTSQILVAQASKADPMKEDAVLISGLQEISLLIEKMSNLIIFILSNQYLLGRMNLVNPNDEKAKDEIKAAFKDLVSEGDKLELKEEIAKYDSCLQKEFKKSGKKVAFDEMGTLINGRVLLECYYSEVLDKISGLNNLTQGMKQNDKMDFAEQTTQIIAQIQKVRNGGVFLTLPINMSIIRQELFILINKIIMDFAPQALERAKVKALENLEEISIRSEKKLNSMKLDPNKRLMINKRVEEDIQVAMQEIKEAENFSEIYYTSFDQFWAKIEPQIKKAEIKSTLPYWGWPLFGVGVASIAAGIGFTVAANNESEKLDLHGNWAGKVSDLKGNRLNEYTYSAYGTYIAGGVLFAIGASLLIAEAATRPSEEIEDNKKPKLSILPVGNKDFVGTAFRIDY